MECPFCKDDMIDGKIKLYEFGSTILHMPATMKFVPSDKSHRKLTANQTEAIEGWFCKKCNKIVAIASANSPIFG